MSIGTFYLGCGNKDSSGILEEHYSTNGKGNSKKQERVGYRIREDSANAAARAAAAMARIFASGPECEYVQRERNLGRADFISQTEREMKYEG